MFKAVAYIPGVHTGLSLGVCASVLPSSEISHAHIIIVLKSSLIHMQALSQKEKLNLDNQR